MGMLIDLFSSDLVAGYKELKNARQALVKKWRFELLRAYTEKWNRYTEQLARQERRGQRYQRLLPFIGLVLLLICGWGAWLTIKSEELACLGMIRSEEHTSELQSPYVISYAVFCLK